LMTESPGIARPGNASTDLPGIHYTGCDKRRA
jgi:hypothetical protein